MSLKQLRNMTRLHYRKRRIAPARLVRPLTGALLHFDCHAHPGMNTALEMVFAL